MASGHLSFQFQTEGNGQNEIISRMDRSEVNLTKGEKVVILITYSERDFEAEKCHRKWA